MKNRSINLDVIRVVALIFVFAVHSFSQLGFYNLPLNNITAACYVFLRQIFFTCVPLFMLLTGYLQKDKTLEKYSFKRLIRIVIDYIFISVITITLIQIFFPNPTFSITNSILSTINFDAIPYAWYIEMYIGLFLLIPFLNLLFKSLKTKEKKQWLIVIFLLLTTLSPLLNNFSFNNYKLEVASGYWNALYPITYYFIGSYLHEYPLKMKKGKTLLLIGLTTGLWTLLKCLMTESGHFSWSNFEGYNIIIAVLLSVLIMNFILKLSFENVPSRLNKVISKLSMLSLDMYLFSYFADRWLYTRPWFTDLAGKFYLKTFIISVPIILLTTFLLSLAKDLIFKFFHFLFKKIQKNRMAS